MGKIFINQDVLKIELSYGDSLPGTVAHAYIKYRNPAGTEGTFPREALYDAGNELYYLTFIQGETLGDYGDKGTWKFWLYLELTDGRVIPGEIVSEKIYDEGRG